MFIKRKWAKMGNLLKFYVRTFSVLLVAIFVLAYHLWIRQGYQMIESTTSLDVKTQETTQRGKK